MTVHVHGQRDLRADIAAACRFRRGDQRPHLDESVIRSEAKGSLVERFSSEAIATGMTVSTTPTTSLADEIERVVRTLGNGSVVGDQELRDLCCNTAILDRWISDPSSDELYAAAIGLVSADAGLAETGSVIRNSSWGRPRSFAVMPPRVVVVLDTARLLPDLFDWLATLDARAMPASSVIISGPSKTADIGMKLITGAHGPESVHIIVTQSNADAS